MLARANRLVSGNDFRVTSRQGRRTQTAHLVVMSLKTEHDRPARFGFTMTRKVGNAVTRNRIRRQLRSIAWEMVHDGVTGVDVVIRGLPKSAMTDWDTLHTELSTVVRGEVGVTR